MVKIVAHYLPQFYEFSGNSAWWHKGHTDWTAVQGARPLFKTHYQPRRSLNGKYYRLDDGQVLKWQARLALAYGIYGFCFWHYWYNGKPLWEKPTEFFHSDPSLKLRYCLAWDNNPSTKTEPFRDQRPSMEQQYGKAPDWQRHFSYVAQFFEDPRYIKIDQKPVFLINDSNHIADAGHLLESWDTLAINRGFPGICFIQMLSHQPLDRRSLPFSAKLYCEPGYTIRHGMPPLKKDTSLRSGHNVENLVDSIDHVDYDDIYKSLLQRPVGKDVLEIPGVFTDWDDSPRQDHNATVCSGSTPARFETYLLRQIERSLAQFDTNIIFVNAWNAWADGAYLEPDERYGNSYLEAIKGAKERSYGLDLPLFYRTIF